MSRKASSQINTEMKKTNGIFKILSAALLKTKKHARVLRKILAAYLKEHWEKLYPHWKETCGKELASECCKKLAEGECNWPVAVNVAANLFKTQISVSRNGEKEICFGPGSADVSIRLLTEFNQETSEPRYELLKDNVENDADATEEENCKNCVSNLASENEREIFKKMAPRDHMASSVSSTGSTRPVHTDDARSETTKMAASMAEEDDEPRSEAPAARPPSGDAMSSGGCGGTRPGRWPDPADAESAPLTDSSEQTTALQDVNKPSALVEDKCARENFEEKVYSESEIVSKQSENVQVSDDARQSNSVKSKVDSLFESTLTDLEMDRLIQEMKEEMKKTFPMVCDCGVPFVFRTNPERFRSYEEPPPVKIGDLTFRPNSIIEKVLSDIFRLSEINKWPHHPSWHHLHMMRKELWTKKRLTDLWPSVKTELNAEKFSRARVVFSRQQKLLK